MQKLKNALAVVLLLSGCKVQNVDVAQPVATADRFYKALEKGDGRTALAQFAPAFKSEEQQWPRLLTNLQQKYGPVTAVTLQGSSLAANGEDPCYLLTYATQRGILSSTETLFICAKGNTPPWLITGHSLTRLDTNQSISGGVLPSEDSVHVP